MLNVVLIRLDRTHVVVMLDILLLQMGALVKVTKKYTLCLALHHFFTSDINECDLGIDLCTQTCLNTIGSYTCSCRSGYRLDRDGYTCNGTA